MKRVILCLSLMIFLMIKMIIEDSNDLNNIYEDEQQYPDIDQNDFSKKRWFRKI